MSRQSYHDVKQSTRQYRPLATGLIPPGYTQSTQRRPCRKVPAEPTQTKVPDTPSAPKRSIVLVRRTVVVVATLVLMVAIGATGMNISFEGEATVAAPVVMLAPPENESGTPLHYGVQPLLSTNSFFDDLHTQFTEQQLTFIEADLTAMEVHYFENGEEVFSAPILSKGKEGSWWETPAGLYQIELKKKDHFSSFGNVHQPWSMVFQGNFFIHGWPKYPDGTPVPEGYSGGCIRLSDEDAEALYELVAAGTPVLVHEEDFQSDDFIYEHSGPDLEAEQYLLADIHNNSILATEGLDDVVPIASITKLMTALVAAEYINLDNTVSVTQERYVQSLVPRLEGKRQVSMYSLLQLLLVESSNEAAEVIAAQIGRERFIALMNEKAASIGLANTVFTDPSGLDEGNRSSVRDLLRLAQYLEFNRKFILELTADQDLPTAYVSGEFGELDNFNWPKNASSTFISGKVGETLAAKQTSVSLHQFYIEGEPRTLAFIVLGTWDRDADIATLESYVQATFGGTVTEQASSSQARLIDDSAEG